MGPLTRLAVVGCVAAIAVSGCGSSKKSSSAPGTGKSTIEIATGSVGPLPQPKETLSAFEKRYTAAVAGAAAGRCASATAFARESGYDFGCRAGKPSKALAGFKITGSATYGTGAVIEFTEGDVPGRGSPMPGFTPPVKRDTAILPVALDTTGRYASALIVSAPSILQGPVIGTQPNSWSGADSTAISFLKAVQASQCTAWFKYSLTPKGMPQKQACAIGLTKLYAPLRQALTGAGPVKVYRLGGNAFVYFYGFKLSDGKLRTLTVTRSGTDPPFFVTDENRSQ